MVSFILIVKSVDLSPSKVRISVPLYSLPLIFMVFTRPDDVLLISFIIILLQSIFNLLQNSFLLILTLLVKLLSGDSTLCKYSLLEPNT